MLRLERDSEGQMFSTAWKGKNGNAALLGSQVKSPAQCLFSWEVVEPITFAAAPHYLIFISTKAPPIWGKEDEMMQKKCNPVTDNAAY